MILNNKNFIKSLNKEYIFENKPSIAVALSGGPDSMALVCLLSEWCKFSKANLIAIIVNHNIRKNSLEEATNVKKFLRKYNIKSIILSVKKFNIKKNTMNEARINRFNLLTNYCKKNNILYLFMAHHKDDNIETFITRKISGSDFDGLSAIKNISLQNKTIIIRPLLNYTKKEILNYNIKNNINFVLDPSNKNVLYTRPSIRNYLSKTSKKNKVLISREFDLIREKSSLYKKMISQIVIKNIIDIKKNYVKINYLKFNKLDELLSEKLVKKIYQFFFKMVILRSSKVQIFIKAIKKQETKKYNLGQMVIKKADNSLIFIKKPTK